jgi:hypothetical protein
MTDNGLAVVRICTDLGRYSINLETVPPSRYRAEGIAICRYGGPYTSQKVTMPEFLVTSVALLPLLHLPTFVSKHAF